MMLKKIAILVLVVALNLLVACSPSEKTIGNNTLSCSWESEPTSFDLTKYTGANDLKLIWNVYEPLVRICEGKVIAAGAKSWEVAEDGLTYTFTLNNNYWSDGKKVLAEDYVEMLKRMADPANLFSFATDYYAIKNFEAINRGELGADSIGAESLDDNTLVLSLEYRDNNFLTSVELYPERKDIVEKYGNKYGFSADTMVCCGPFVLTEWNHNSDLQFTKNARYWDNDHISLDAVNVRIIPDSATRYMEFKAGTIDYLSVSDENYLKEFRGNSDMYEVKAQSARTYMFVMNTKDALLQNVKIRQALSLTVNREEICSVLDDGLTTPAYGVIPPATMVGNLDYRENVVEPLMPLKAMYPDPKALFKEGLSELGIDNQNNVTIVLSCPSDSASQNMAEYYKQMWEKNLDITIEINMQEFASYRSLIWSEKYQIATTAWGGSLEPKFLLSKWLLDNQCQWDDDRYTEMFNNALLKTDDQERLEGFASAEEYLVADNAVIIPIKYDGYSIFYRKYVSGTNNCPFDNTGFRNISVNK